MTIIEHVDLVQGTFPSFFSIGRLLALLLDLLLNITLKGKTSHHRLLFRRSFRRLSNGSWMFFGHISPPHAFSSVLSTCFFLYGPVIVQLFLVSKSIWALNIKLAKFLSHWVRFDCMIVLLSKVCEDASKVDVFFLHFLVMAPTLLSLPSPYEQLHSLEYFVCSAHVAVDKVLVMNLQEPVVPLVFFQHPVSMILLLRVLLVFLSPSTPLL